MAVTLKAKNINEALDFRSANDSIVFAGGTDLMVEHLRGSNLIAKFDKPILFINDIDELKGVKEDENNIIIGALTTFDEIIKSDLTPQVLKDSASGIAGPPIRNIATIGGNICNASPSADSLPSLYAMDAVLILKSKNSQREVKIKDFITGVSKTILKNDEILTHIIIPKKDYKYSFYRKIGTRKANALSKLAICALVCKENEKYRFKISFCTLGVTVTRDESIEEKFIVSNIKEWKNNIKSIQEAYSSIMNPRNSARSTALYRKKCALNLIEYFLDNINL
ncbi:FAD binding domain-containing protein [Brachyspira hyodysenteriae]|uniref:Aerobic-type carbon monoxide dehydrogenase, middle subunit CoxM/CutM s n=2 Tax=Brachyspira hyodysenteriae TaxID=159 RepID=A0A3B6V7Q4_BRAHW|nr:FAD binding domain-containing protein [Brachyspira hyodysenteriae]ABS50206.1 CoxM [Brachyspira hyodysenteriae]ACN82563.1 aerobic-type carbon monoxide dehydrogenase, middle subunit CoxM/CutM s [Brachyspira hyodysenteriae WA1]AUJ50888.1 carbon monoxide dehydrogenase medium subunit [Brachyspira hyodysenteriae]KLI13380.1 carbon monoxide dehydrogenase [Brachyspira hyodysenteriae]KLI15671.1 carbon monoxide dehydrogenase [Brachyspira hyodysenteriae]